MPDLEPMIAEWRKRMSAKLPKPAVRELETHLRDHLEAQTGRGMTPAEAFAEAVRRIGTPESLVPGFSRLEASRSWTIWRQGVVISYLAAGAALVVFLGYRETLPVPLTPLLVTHVFTIATGYLALLAAGMLGAGGLVVACHRGMGDMERSDLRSWSIRLTFLGGMLQAVGIVLGMVWAADNLGRAWGWDPKETGAALIFASTWILLLAQARHTLGDRARGIIAVLGGTAVLIGWFGVNAVTATVPIAWLGVANILAQAAVLVLRPGKQVAD